MTQGSNGRSESRRPAEDHENRCIRTSCKENSGNVKYMKLHENRTKLLFDYLVCASLQGGITDRLPYRKKEEVLQCISFIESKPDIEIEKYKRAQ